MSRTALASAVKDVNPFLFDLGGFLIAVTLHPGRLKFDYQNPRFLDENLKKRHHPGPL
ncbi:MAG: hypothetical protein WBE50_02710 [Methyloceanibacter sp.]